jgi:predicted nucleic acid-binding protein
LTFLIDTNVISELRKKTRCNANVAAWYATVDNSGLYLSVLVTGEIRKGIEQIKQRDPIRPAKLEAWLTEIEMLYEDRIIPIDREITDQWGRFSAMRTLPAVDGLLVATAKVKGLTLVTRNIKNVVGLGVLLLNPIDPQLTLPHRTH